MSDDRPKMERLPEPEESRGNSSQDMVYVLFFRSASATLPALSAPGISNPGSETFNVFTCSALPGGAGETFTVISRRAAPSVDAPIIAVRATFADSPLLYEIAGGGEGLPPGSGQYKVLQLNGSDEWIADYVRAHS